MSNVIEFKKHDDLISFGPIIDGDGYLELTALNALQALEYELTPEGVKEAQHEFDIEETGIVDVETFTRLLCAFNVEDRQYILNMLKATQINYEKNQALDKEAKDVSDSSKKKTFSDKVTEFIVFLMFIVILLALFLGLKDIWQWIYSFIK